MISRKFAGQFSSLEVMSEFVAQAAQTAGLGVPEVYAVQLAVDEAATNIIEHGYGGEGRGEIECIFEIIPEGLRVTLRDYGRPFAPEDIPEPTLNVPLEEVKPRGLGLFFMRKFMDDVRFEFSAQAGNAVIMTKHKR
jgi:serine/threonine-protein kinase RsbW